MNDAENKDWNARLDTCAGFAYRGNYVWRDARGHIHFDDAYGDTYNTEGYHWEDVKLHMDECHEIVQAYAKGDATVRDIREFRETRACFFFKL